MMLDQFLEHLRSSGLLDSDSQILVAYSGGPDSTCLLHLLQQGGFNVVAAHLHHGQRTEADTELKLCQAFCDELGVPFVSGRADVPRLSKELKVSLEEAGRIARYEFFNSAAMSTGCDLIATAHTQDDQVETVLLHITRGTGLNGLSGIPVKRANIVRPLLPFTRAQTHEFCEKRGLWTHADPANTDLKHSRARLRSNVVPQLKAINPDVYGSISRLADIAKEETEFLDGMAAAALEKSEIPLNGDLAFLTRHIELALDRGILGHLPDVLLKRSLRLAVAAIGGTLDSHQLLIAFQGIRSQFPGSVTGEKEPVSLSWNESQIHVVNKEEVGPFRFNLTVPGETFADDFGWVITAIPSAMPNIKLGRRDLETFIDLESVKGSLYFRNWKQADEMTPLGFDGHRKISDLMSESRLTIETRKRLPLVCDIIGPIWVPGVCLDNRVKARSGSSGTMRLTFGSQVQNGPTIETAHSRSAYANTESQNSEKI
ncbi:MAG TPA: tRNA lysidine(34) synthetase TilS [Fimbriimonadaceae bacterium]|jgi:tRNA(Ile)-lysidine synthase